jgi:hypothetical protein
MAIMTTFWSVLWSGTTGGTVIDCGSERDIWMCTSPDCRVVTRLECTWCWDPKHNLKDSLVKLHFAWRIASTGFNWDWGWGSALTWKGHWQHTMYGCWSINALKLLFCVLIGYLLAVSTGSKGWIKYLTGRKFTGYIYGPHIIWRIV